MDAYTKTRSSLSDGPELALTLLAVLALQVMSSPYRKALRKHMAALNIRRGWLSTASFPPRCITLLKFRTALTEVSYRLQKNFVLQQLALAPDPITLSNPLSLQSPSGLPRGKTRAFLSFYVSKSLLLSEKCSPAGRSTTAEEP